MELRWLEDFLKLSELGNFSRAAAARNISQPAFSRRIRSLEDWIGDELFDRGQKPLLLTVAGERFRPIAEELVERAHLARFGDTDPVDAGELQAASRFEEAPPLKKVGALAQKPLIAIPPFSSLRSTEEDEFLAMGMADTIALELGNSLFATAVERAKTFRAYEREPTIENVAAETGATHVLDGTYAIVGRTARLTVRLVDVATGVLWSRKFRVDVSNILSAVDEIGARIAWTIAAVFERGLATHALKGAYPGRGTAVEHFIRGNYILRTKYRDSHIDARAHFQQAIDENPSFVRAHVGLAHTYAREYHTYPLRRHMLDEAVSQARRATEIDPSDSFAQIWLAQFLAYQGDIGAARYASDIAIKLEPNDPHTIFGKGVIACFTGDYDVAEECFLRTLDHEPVFLQRVRHFIGHLYYLTRRFDEALSMYDGMADTVAWNFSFRLAALGQLQRAELASDRRYFLETFDEEQRHFALQLYPFSDQNAVPLLLEGYEKAGILSDVGLSNVSSLAARRST